MRSYHFLGLHIEPEGVPLSHLYYEAAVTLLFVSCLAHAVRSGRAALRRLATAAVYGTTVEVGAYICMEVFQPCLAPTACGRMYDAGRFVVSATPWRIPVLEMAPMWYVAVLYMVDVAARRLYGSVGFFSRLVVATVLAISADVPIEPVAVMHGFWRYRVDTLGYEHFAGVIWVNTIAWFGIQGGASAGMYVLDKLFKKGGAVLDVVSVLVSAVVGLACALAWFGVMTVARAPLGWHVCSDSVLVLFLLAACAPLVLSLRRTPSSDAADCGVAATGKCWPFWSVLAWHLVHLVLLVLFPCNSPFNKGELCTRDGLFTTAAFTLFSLALFLPPGGIAALFSATKKLKPKIN
jgi:hypothetical protein